MTHDPIQRMKHDFITDASETVDRVASFLATLDVSIPLPRPQVDWLFRTAHSLKGASAMFELKDVSRIAESMENILEEVRSGSLGLKADVIDLLLEALGELAILLKRAGGEHVEDHSDLVVQRIESFLRLYSAQGMRPDPQLTGAGQGPVSDEDKKSTPPDPHQETQSLSVKVDIGLLDSIMNNVSELFAIRLALLGMAHRLPQNEQTRRLRDDLLKLSLVLNKRASGIEGSVVEARLVPMAMLFDRYTHEVRRLARQAGKEVRLIFKGEATRVDRALLNRLHDPLLHLIRNAISHGIEPKEARIAAGKPEAGTILVRAQQEGNHVRIDVEDDGAGIDLENVRAGARRKGIRWVSDASLVTALFQPGFSTKAKADSLSGRGVGLDAVKSRVEAMRGAITVDTNRATGTRFSIWVPFTLAVSTGMLVEEQGIPVAIPRSCVSEVLRISKEISEQMQRAGFIEHHGTRLKIIRLSSVLGTVHGSSSGSVVIVGVGDQRRAMVTQKVCGETQIVCRPLPGAITAPGFITGASELQDGRPAIVIQPEQIRGGAPHSGHSPTEGERFSLPADISVCEVEGQRALVRLLLFRVDGGVYGLPFHALQEVIAESQVTETSILGCQWRGLFFLRGMCHALLNVPGSRSGVGANPRRIIILRFPERCGIGSTQVLHEIKVPFSELEIVPSDGESTVLSILGRVRVGDDETVNVLDIGDGLRRQVPQIGAAAQQKTSITQNR